MKKSNLLLTASVLTSVLAGVSFAHAQATSDDPSVLIKDGNFFGEVRYRAENVDQNNALNNASAHTIRTNVGFKTGTYKGFQALGETQLVRHMGDEDFNSLDNGQTGFSVVADPDVAQLNRAWLSFSGVPDTVVKVGRQAVNLDNQRFIGTVGWRQNDQTFDAVTITNESINKLKAQYTYIANVNRIFEEGAQQDDLDSASHLANLTYTHADWLKATAYGYLMEFSDAAALSNETYGLRLSGKAPINDHWTFGYEAEYAKQENYENNTNNYDEDYYHIAPSISGHGFMLKAGLEVLEGDGTNSFKTPLATLHKFNGWADTFLTTPANGLEDAYVMASYKVGGTNTLLDDMKFSATYHDFEGEESGNFGSELDLSVGKAFTLPDAGQPFKKVNVLVKYADYNAEDAPYVDTEKFWVQLGIKF